MSESAATPSESAAMPDASAATPAIRLVLIDDDELTREILTLQTAAAGFTTSALASGEDALAFIATLDCRSRPQTVLADMQMPGLAGGALAQQLRRLCGPATLLLAMSGSPVARENLAGYDGFLLKPFSADDLKAASARTRSVTAHTNLRTGAILNEDIYRSLAGKMPPAQVEALYRMCLDDAAKRIATMTKAAEIRDDTAYRRAAHAIKGGCGMVGATELAAIAAAMESSGLPPAADSTRLESFQAASARLERMLEDKVRDLRAASLAP